MESKLIEELKAENKKLESDKRAAASFGLELLNENRDLKAKLSSRLPADLKDYEEIVQENYSLKKRLETKKTLESEAERQIVSLQSKLKSAVENVTTELEEAFERKYSALSKKKSTLEHELEEARKGCRSAELKIEEMEREATMRKRIEDDSLLSSPSDRSYNKLSMECQTLSEENSALQNLIHELKIEFDLAQHQIQKLNEEVKEWRETAENLESSVKSYKAKITSMQEDMDEMRCAMAELEAASKGPSKKGNSVYGELDEQRRLVEMELVSLHDKQQRLIVENGKLEKEIDRWKRKCAANLRASSESVASAEQVRLMKEELDRTRGELRLERSRRLKALEQTQKDFSAPRPTSGSNPSSSGLPSDSIIRERVDKLQKENKSMVLEAERIRLERTCIQDDLIQEQKKRFQLEERIREVERQKDFLRVQIEELQVAARAGTSAHSTSILASGRPKIKMNSAVKSTLNESARNSLDQPNFEETMEFSVDSSVVEGNSDHGDSRVSATDITESTLTTTAAGAEESACSQSAGVVQLEGKENAAKSADMPKKKRRGGRKVHTGIGETEGTEENAGECKQQ